MISFTPSASQVGTLPVPVFVLDDGTPRLGDSRTFSVTVARTRPVVSAGSDTVLNRGRTLSRSVSVSGPGSVSLNATVDYGDGAGPQALAMNSDGTFSLLHQSARGVPIRGKG